MANTLDAVDEAMDEALDIIGDVHGQARLLTGLLQQMGYRDDGEAWRHPERTVVFIGDLIDRGPGQLETIDIARRMVAAGSARIVMGNHEYNAIAWATRHPDRPDDYLRTRAGRKGEDNRDQHAAFLDQVGPDSSLHHELVEWFRTIPLWLDLGTVRFVHACWDAAAMAHLAPRLGPNRTLTDELLVTSSTKHHPDYEAVELLLKGPEVPLPEGYEYIDNYAIPRRRARFAWWDTGADTYATSVLVPSSAKRPDGSPYPPLPDAPVPTPPATPYHDDIPLFVGHYWRTGPREALGDHVVCVDYSAGKHGPLVAYRWDGGRVLRADKFVHQDR